MPAQIASDDAASVFVSSLSDSEAGRAIGVLSNGRSVVLTECATVAV